MPMRPRVLGVEGDKLVLAPIGDPPSTPPKKLELAPTAEPTQARAADATRTEAIPGQRAWDSRYWNGGIDPKEHLDEEAP